MQIDSGISRLLASQGMQAPTLSKTTPGNASATASTAATSEESGIQSLDFNNMTRQELFDWMNSQIRSGAMTLDESTPFLGMTLKMSAATGEPIDMATDTERINFVDRATQGIEGARWFNDKAGVERFEAAIAMMMKQQGEAFGIDVRA